MRRRRDTHHNTGENRARARGRRKQDTDGGKTNQFGGGQVPAARVARDIASRGRGGAAFFGAQRGGPPRAPRTLTGGNAKVHLPMAEVTEIYAIGRKLFGKAHGSRHRLTINTVERDRPAQREWRDVTESPRSRPAWASRPPSRRPTTTISPPIAARSVLLSPGIGANACSWPGRGIRNQREPLVSVCARSSCWPPARAS